jgi:folate-dependent phosphoribosylglycinamide formyltransferase PurN
MRTALICHDDNLLNREVLPRWLNSFSEVAGIVIISETGSRLRKRLRFEWRRSGIRMIDVLAFRLYYRLRLARADSAWVNASTRELMDRYEPLPPGIPVHETADPNDEATRRFLEGAKPDLVIARCKTLLRSEIFDIPPDGTIVLHPGICPEYRNAHGCFWALARRDLDKVGATMLRIDEGVDTGPIYAYYDADIDERSESHVVIQYRVVFDNLDRIADDLRAVHERRAQPLETTGRPSAAWGQPRLTDYFRWKRAAAA